MSYTQLTREQRYQIKVLLKAGHIQTQIAVLVGCHKSTISRELRRNRGAKGYRPYQDETAYDRQCDAYRSRIAWQTWQQVERLLRQQWSPEQIAGRLVRQYFPKKYDFARIRTQDLQQVEDLLNNQPLKTLGYRTQTKYFSKWSMASHQESFSPRLRRRM